MRAPEFEAMIGPAKLYPQIWRLLLGILVILFSAVLAMPMRVAPASSILALCDFESRQPENASASV